VALRFRDQEVTARTQQRVNFGQESLAIRDLVHHPERQDEVNWALNADCRWCGLVEPDSICYPATFGTASRSAEHLRLKIHGDHGALRPHEFCHGDREEAKPRTYVYDGAAWPNEAVEDFRGSVK
jgi:hypothetical protein